MLENSFLLTVKIILMARKDDEIYCFDLLKGGIKDTSLSVGARMCCIVFGVIGTVVVDPVRFIFNKLGISDDPADPDDPNSPFNSNY